MRLPALWILGALALGIEAATLRQFSMAASAIVAAVAILLSAALLWRRQSVWAWAFALAAWAALGCAAVAMQHASVPGNSVERLVAAGRLDVSEPLRWRGRLRADPQERPWVQEFEIDLEQVESKTAAIPVRGGLRASLYSERADGERGESLRAGDRIEALLKASPPRNFQDPGAFDEKAYLATQGINLTGSLRSRELLTLVDRPTPGWKERLARAHGSLLQRVDRLFSASPENAALLRAMLLGDRSFVDTATSTAFQKTAVYHVLVVAGLHTGALVVFLFWLCRRLHVGMIATIAITLAGLAAYVGVVEDRPPIFRAACMAAIYLPARPLFRRVELLNTVALAAIVLLVRNPSLLQDSSFQLSFLAAGVIAGLALPWIDRTSAPYRAGLAHLGDVTRDVTHPPRVAQFRLEARAAIAWLRAHLPQRWGVVASSAFIWPVGIALRFWELLLVSLAIQLGMLPLLAQDFHRVSLTGPVSNLPAVLLTGIIVPAGFLTLACSFVSWRLAGILSRFVGMLSGLLLSAIEWLSRIPHASYRVPGPPRWVTIAFLVALAVLAATGRSALLARRDRMARRRLAAPTALSEWSAVAAVGMLAILIAWYPFRPRLTRGRTEVTVLDVGQGDSIFAAFPDGRTMLVDGGGLAGSEWIKDMRSGPDVGEEVVSPYLWSRGLKKLDVVAVTHGHHDHIGGLASVLVNFRVQELWVGREEDAPEFRDLMEIARERGVRIVHKTQGEEGGWDGVLAKILWPPSKESARNASNDDSLVIRLEDGDAKFLLTGDIEQREERAILASGADLDADFLKVPHHGSKTSSTPSFLAAIHPRIAVVSVGAGNAYGHPAGEVVGRYEEDGVHLFRTDRDGAVTASSDGHTMSVRGFSDVGESMVVAEERN